MVLVTGPTGSGKTTTLYAALNEIKSEEDKIITIEDPVEYQIRGITQIPVNEKKGLTFARGLRSILRHDPDKILVGEIRDAETAQIAINSALTGHLVFTTVHANNVVDVLGRFLNMGVEPYNFVSALNCILAQRLVRHRLRLLRPLRSPTRTPNSVESGLEPLRVGAVSSFAKVPGAWSVEAPASEAAPPSTSSWSSTTRFARCSSPRSPASEIRKKARDKGMDFLRDSALERVRERHYHPPRDQQGHLHRGGPIVMPRDRNFAKFRWLWFAMAMYGLITTPFAATNAYREALSYHRVIFPMILALFIRVGTIYLFFSLWLKHRPVKSDENLEQSDQSRRE